MAFGIPMAQKVVVILELEQLVYLSIAIPYLHLWECLVS